jgi:HD-GYP domain-containing protein (c-di-GMP phosphodiesterase class II)
VSILKGLTARLALGMFALACAVAWGTGVAMVRWPSAWHQWLAGGLIIGATGSITLAWLFTRHVLAPLRGISDGALQLAQGKFGVQSKVAGQTPELAALVETFNYMSSQLFAYGEENQRLYATLEDGCLETIVALANSLDSKDAYTRGHSQRVGEMSVEIGREMGLPESDLRALRYGGILHDIGKIGIVESILHKQARLTDAEMTIMREHPMIGDSIMGHIRFLSPVRAAVRHHHERYDGNGYPDKLRGEAIPQIARIVACADTFDACTSQRPYQAAISPFKAMEIIKNLSGQQFDPVVVQALDRVVQKQQANQAMPLAS